MKLTKTIVLSFIWMGFFLKNAAGLTLEEAVTTAEQKNHELNGLRNKTAAAQWKRLEAISTYIPHFTLEGSHIFENKLQVMNVSLGGGPSSEFPLVVPESTGSARLEWTVFDGFKGWNNYQAASLRHEALSLDEQRKLFQLEEDVRIKFFQALAAEKLAEVAAENISVLEGHRRDAQNQEKGGASTRFDVLRIEVQLEEARTEKNAADDNVILSRIKLAEAMGVQDAPSKLEGTLPEPIERDLEKVSENVSTRDDVKAEELRTQATRKDLWSSRSDWLPEVSFFGEGMYYNNQNKSISDTDAFRNAYTVGLKLHWNVFDGGRSISKEKQNFYEAKASEEKSKSVETKSIFELQVWKRKIQYAVSQYRAKLAQVEKAKESVRLAKNARNAGVRTNTDVLDAELDMFKAQAGVVKSQADYVEAFSELQLALGRHL